MVARRKQHYDYSYLVNETEHFFVMLYYEYIMTFIPISLRVYFTDIGATVRMIKGKGCKSEGYE